jgi:hypothetical protein
MAGTKLLYIFVIVIVALAIYLLFISGFNQNASALTQEGIDSIKNAGTCFVNTFNNKCTQKQTDSSGNNCIFDQFGGPEYDCTVCEKTLGSDTVYSCQFAACGCGYGWTETFGSIKVFLNQISYKSGDTIKVTGILTTPEIRDRTGLEISLSFLDGDKRATRNLEGGTTNAIDNEGNYEWEYEIPENAQTGTYFLLAEHNNARELAEFKIEK